jgi:hypothetical protein
MVGETQGSASVSGGLFNVVFYCPCGVLTEARVGMVIVQHVISIAIFLNSSKGNTDFHKV